MNKHLLLAAFCSLGLVATAHAQTCPPNIDFEQGNFTNWNFSIGVNNGSSYFAFSPTAPLPGRHVLTSGATTDPLAGFPIVCPAGGSYSLKLGNDLTGAQTDRAHYTFTVPVGVNNYSLIYRYAVVFQDPGHAANDQPFFKVRAYNTVTGATINCGSYTYVAGGVLPGFQQTTPTSNIWFKDWTTASLNLSGQAGNSITVEFIAADCSLGGHFGYGYIDMTCGLFSISGTNCNSGPTLPLSAPSGFQSYTWYLNNFNNQIATGQNPVVPTPTLTSTYFVVLTPYPGFGCPDTLSTQIMSSSLAINALPDTMLCNNPAIQLGVNVQGSSGPFTYHWAPAAGLSCTSCSNPLAAPAASTSYEVTVTDAAGCIRKDTTLVTNAVTVTATAQNALCHNSATGSALAVASGGTGPFSYSWNTTPVQNTAAALNLMTGTYTVTATDTKGCTGVDTISVGQSSALVASISSSSPVSCHGGANGSATVVVSGGLAPYSYSWNTQPAQSTPTLSSLPAGTYIATVTDALGCSDTALVTLAAPPALTALTSAQSPLCTGSGNGSASVIAGGGIAPYSFSWSTLPIQTTATATNLGSGSYTVTVMDAHNCSMSATATLVLPTPVTATISGATPTNCFGANTGSATISGAGGSAPYTYSWNTLPVQTTATASNLAAGSYTATVTDNHGCTGTAVVLISQPSSLGIATQVTNVNCYGGSNGSAVATATGGVPPYTITWSTTPLQTASAINNLNPGAYIATVTDNQGCSSQATALVAQPGLLSGVITATPPFCFGAANGTATVLPSGGTAPYSFSWNTIPVQTTSTAQNLPAGPRIATVTDSKGCILTLPVTLAQPAALSALVTPTPVNCWNSGSGTATVSVTGGTGSYHYSWDGGAPQNAASVLNLSAGAHTVLITDSMGCTLLKNFQILQPTPLSLSTTKTDAICHGGSTGSALLLATGGTPPYQFSWNTIPVQIASIANGLGAGSYTGTVTDALGCNSTATVVIGEPVALQLQAMTAKMPCPGIPEGVLNATLSGGVAPVNLVWNTSPAQFGASAHSLLAGKYIITATDANGCVQTDSVLLQSLPPAKVFAGPDTSACAGSGVTLHASGTEGYLWSPAASLSCSNCATPFATPSESTTYTVVGTSSQNCKDTDQVIIAVIRRGSVSAGPDLKICTGGTARLEAIGGGTYLWSPAFDLDNATVASPETRTGVTTRYQVIITSKECFRDTLSQLVEVVPMPEIRMEPGFRGSPGTQVVLQPFTKGATGISWLPADGLSCSDCFHPVASLSHTITYLARVTNEIGCSAQDTMTITVGCDGSDFYLANTFTPNGDGQNDWFYPQGKSVSQVKRFMVYDRWGEVVFSASNMDLNAPQQGWDGTFRGRLLKPDVYVYVLESTCADNLPVVIKGDISLIR